MGEFKCFETCFTTNGFEANNHLRSGSLDFSNMGYGLASPVHKLVVVLDEQCNIAFQIGSEVLNDLENLRTRVHQMENEMSALRTIQSIACLPNPDATSDPTNLEKASLLIDTIASEICKRIECRHQVLIFNAPDRIPLEHTKTAILTACGMHAHL
ncbi:hypothetical protein CSKR_101457 [Clonorchis sinensis]|uniref:Uncharacterized protein n=1 Tax=Clonorchis sinensis TaxID=79923 RepID=A0A3R7FLT4_CLOSI|nr:hypothetical protein CSKR_101457 [Clonorchis sinensis]